MPQKVKPRVDRATRLADRRDAALMLAWSFPGTCKPAERVRNLEKLLELGDKWNLGHAFVTLT